MIDITSVDLLAFAKKVYELSIPQGLGFLQNFNSDFPENEVKKHIKRMESDNKRTRSSTAEVQAYGTK